MVDTIRTRDELLALLADNTTKNISPQDVRDVLISTFSVWSAIYTMENAVAQTGITTTPVKLANWTGNVAGKGGMTPDFTDGSIEIPIDGDYLALAQVSWAGSVNQQYEIHVAIDTVESPFGMHRKIGAGGDAGSASAIAPFENLSITDKITLYVNTFPSGTAEITAIEAQLFVIKIS